ncbi:MAG: PepSY domain-containing protein, partial [Clostridiales bacterium]|nr:PepSY domain-containing protein [Clostridiales bacterium]
EAAGVTESQVSFIKAYLDSDDGRVVYDIEFYSGDTEYDYEIDAQNGDIVEFDREIEYFRIPQSGSGSPAEPADKDDYIGETLAKSIALERAGADEAQAVFNDIRLDYDDGRVDYDVEFYVGNIEYEYDIDALSGSIIEYSRETENRSSRGTTDTQKQSPKPAASNDTSGYIGEASAKTIALSDAGLTESQVTRMKVSLDRDDRRMVYEVEFRDGRMEYEYEIDAVTGEIIESDSEYDD